MYETLRFKKRTPVYIYIYKNVAVNDIDINLCIISEYK